MNIDVDNVRALREVIVQPIVEPLIQRLTSLEKMIGKHMADLSSNFNRTIDEVRASQRTICDPESGYVPRSQITEIVDGLESTDRDLRGSIDTLRYWVIGFVVTEAGLALSVVGIFLHH